MSIYSDRSTFRVEVTVKGVRYRGRFNDYKDAQIAELQWKAGKSLPERQQPSPAPTLAGDRPRTLTALLKLGKEHIWLKQKDRDTSVRRCEIFIGYLGPHKDPLTITQTDVDEAVEQIEARGVQGATVNRYLSPFNRLTRWGERRGFAKRYIMEWHPENGGRVRTISEIEERQLLDLLMSYGRDDIVALVRISLATGMRRGELLKIRLEDIQGRRITLRDTKNGASHYLTPPQPIVDLLQWYLTVCEPVKAAELRYWWDRARKEMGLADDKWFTWHCMRHTAATRALKAGVDVRIVQKMLNHKRIETTLRYTHVDDAQVENALAAISPASVDNYPQLPPPPAFSHWISYPAASRGAQRKRRKRLPIVASVSKGTSTPVAGGRGGTGRRAGFRFRPIVDGEEDISD